MKSRILFISLALVLALSMALVGCAVTPGARTTITLDFGTFWPAIDFQVTLGHKEWAKVISDRVMAETTNWTVKWNWYYSQTPDTVRANVQAGTWDVMTSGPGYYTGVYPLWEGPEYPADTAVLPRKNALTMSMAYQALWGNFTPLQAEFAAKEPNFQLMHYWATGPGYFLMTYGNNVTTLADFPGKTIRAANPASVLTINALNGTGYKCGMGEAYAKFQAGTIQGILCPTDTPKGFGLSAYVRSCTYAPFSYQFVFYKVMNKATYDGLPPEVRTIIDSVNAKYPEYYGQLRTWGEYDGLAFCRSSLGLNISWFEYNLPVANPTEYQNWLAAVYPGLITTWISGNTTKAQLWGNFTAIQTYYTNTAPWSTWTYTSAPPTPPTFP